MTPVPNSDQSSEIRIGVSACIVGQPVRFDGGHKRDRFLTDKLSGYVTFVPVCPEVEIGMGAPRETVRLVKDGDGVRMVAPKSGTDWTVRMRAYADAKVTALEQADLSGYILKSGSPTCGMERVRVYDENGVPSKKGRGIFAEVLAERLPLLPVEEDGRLNDARLRENFFSRVFAYRRLRDLFGGDWTIDQLVRFHAREKLNLMAHDTEGARRLGRLVAAAADTQLEALPDDYSRIFMATLTKVSKTRTHSNVLQRVLGFFRGVLGDEERREIRALVDEFQRGLVPLVVPLTMIRHYVRLHRLEYLAEQSYFDPHPRELMLRNPL